MKKPLGLGLAAAALGAAGLWMAFRPLPGAGLPLAALVPADALFFAAGDVAEVDRLPRAWTDPFRERLDRNREHLAGPMAFYVDREGEWLVLSRLTRTAALLGGSEVVDGVAVTPQTPAALERHKARKGRLSDDPRFVALGSRIFADLEALKLPGHLRDYGAAGFDLVPGPPLVLRGRALYRGGLFRLYVENYLHAPLRAAPEGKAPAQAVLTVPFPRLWDEITHELLPLDREKVDREASALSRDFLGGRGVRDFLAKVGPSLGLSAVPGPDGVPVLTGWVELADESTGATLAKMLHRTAHDVETYARNRGERPVFELSTEETSWRLRLRDSPAPRLGDAWSPAFMFKDRRLLFSTCAALLEEPPPPAEGPHHAAAAFEFAPLFALADALAPAWTDASFLDEAESKAAALYGRMFSGPALAALQKRFPDPNDLSRHLAAQKSRLVATALADLSKTPAWEKEHTRTQERLASARKAAAGLDRAAFSGRFTADGLQFEARLWVK